MHARCPNILIMANWRVIMEFRGTAAATRRSWRSFAFSLQELRRVWLLSTFLRTIRCIYLVKWTYLIAAFQSRLDSRRIGRIILFTIINIYIYINWSCALHNAMISEYFLRSTMYRNNRYDLFGETTRREVIHVWFARNTYMWKAACSWLAFAS